MTAHLPAPTLLKPAHTCTQTMGWAVGSRVKVKIRIRARVRVR